MHVSLPESRLCWGRPECQFFEELHVQVRQNSGNGRTHRCTLLLLIEISSVAEVGWPQACLKQFRDLVWRKSSQRFISLQFFMNYLETIYFINGNINWCRGRSRQSWPVSHLLSSGHHLPHNFWWQQMMRCMAINVTLASYASLKNSVWLKCQQGSNPVF